MDIPKNKAISIDELAKLYKETYNEELPNIVFRDPNGYPIFPATTKAAAKPENEVKKLNNMMNEVNYLANMEKPEPTKYAVSQQLYHRF